MWIKPYKGDDFSVSLSVYSVTLCVTKKIYTEITEFTQRSTEDFETASFLIILIFTLLF
jgi:hypothetical protein